MYNSLITTWFKLPYAEEVVESKKMERTDRGTYYQYILQFGLYGLYKVVQQKQGYHKPLQLFLAREFPMLF